MQIHHTLEPIPTDSIPMETEGLSSESPHLFLPMPWQAAEQCLATRGVPPASLINQHLGDQTLNSRLARRRMPDPFTGYMGHFAALGWTPKSVGHYASTSPRPAPNVLNVAKSDVVVATTLFDRLKKSGAVLAFSDGNPLHSKTRISTDVALKDLPWDLLRKARFGGDKVDPDRTRRYSAQVLVYGVIPNDIVVFAVRDEAASLRLRTYARSVGADDVAIVVRDRWYFG